MRVGDEIIVITWLHCARREVLNVRPRGDVSHPLTGVFSTRSPDRPNLVGASSREGSGNQSRSFAFGPIEAIDGTPVIDIEPVVETKDY